MELDDLLKGEGLDAADIEDALAWARQRAEQLVQGVDGDPELGPLLGGALAVGGGGAAVASAPVGGAQPASPAAAPPSSDAGRFSLDSDPAAAPGDESEALEAEAPGEVTLPAAIEEPGAGDTALEPTAAVDSTETEPETEPATKPEDPPLDPLAGIDFDGLPGLDDDDDELLEDNEAAAPSGAETIERGNTVIPIEREPELTDPELTLPDVTQSLDGGALRAELTEHAASPQQEAGATGGAGVPGGELDGVDVTQRAVNPLEGDEPSSAPVADADDEEIEEIEEFELLDDDDVELVDDDGDADADDGSVPEWQAALTSAQMGGGSRADQHSGLLRPSEVVEASADGAAPPADDAAPPADADAKAAAPSDRAASDDESS